MMKCCKTLILLLVSFATFANTNDFLNTLRAQGMNTASKIDARSIESIKDKSRALKSEHLAMIEGLKRSVDRSERGQGIEEAMLFVSFSMPKSLLFMLADEAATYDIPVVIKGLVDGDFKKTVHKFYALNKKSEMEGHKFKGISIDPVWFDDFQIERVPALVVVRRSKECLQQTKCKAQTFDVVYGNSSIKTALELIGEKGDTRVVAKKILDERHA